MANEQVIQFEIMFMDGSNAIWTSNLSERKSAIATFRAQPDYEIDGVFYTKQAIFSWNIVGERKD